LGAPAATAQPLSFRLEASDQAFTPVHSYVKGELGDQLLFFSGISGFGLHAISQPDGPAPIFQAAADYNQSVLVADRSDGSYVAAPTDHLPETTRYHLLSTNASAFQRGDTLYIYGGYGPTLDESDVLTKAFVTAIDLVAVRDAVEAGQPVPTSAFVTTPCPAAHATGAEIFKLDSDRFVFYGGKIFEGDYPGHTYEEYKSDAYVFDLSVSASAPVQTISEEDSFVQTVMRRRDLNGQVATVKDDQGNLTRGFIVTGGVFRFSATYFDTPVSWMDGDVYAKEDTTVSIKMNLYHSPSASFFDESSGENRIVLFGGITAFDSIDAPVANFFLPWSDTVTENVFDGTQFVEERAIGNTPLPIVNGKLVKRTDLPKAENGQILIDQLPPNEIRFGSIWGGIHAAEPANEPATWASGDVLDVYIVKGVRGDLTGNGVTDAADLATLIGNWGAGGVTSDLNWDGVVDATDLATLIGYWGRDVPG
jgi:hypothetical protein